MRAPLHVADFSGLGQCEPPYLKRRQHAATLTRGRPVIATNRRRAPGADVLADSGGPSAIALTH